MKRALFLAAIVTAVSVVAHEARARVWLGLTSAEELRQQCYQSSKECTAYIIGVADAMAAAQLQMSSLAGLRVCIPDEATPKQLLDVTLRYLNARAGTEDVIAATFVAQALSQAFPCPL